MAYTGTAAAWPIQKAVAAALLADAAIAASLGGDKVYSGSVPAGTAFDYITMAGPSEGEYALFAGGGSSCVLMLHLWRKEKGQRKTAELYGELHRVLNNATLALDGHRLGTASIALVDITPDPAGAYQHGIVRLTITALR